MTGHLFAPDAFAQLPGQLAMATDRPQIPTRPMTPRAAAAAFTAIATVATGAAAAPTAREEERQAREDLRRLQRLQKGAAHARRKAWRRALREAVTETRGRWPECRCDFAGVTTTEQLVSMGCGCTDPFYCCPRLDAIRRRVGA